MAQYSSFPVATLTDRSVSIDDGELAQVRSQLQKFVSQHQISSTGADYLEGNRITKLHWINSNTRNKCHNVHCKAKFTLTQRKHHCRKCGEVLCAKCLQFQRKLSPTADYDPNGKLFMVCSICFNSETQGMGQARFWTQSFLEMRRDTLANRALVVGSTNMQLTRCQLQKECQRLVEGFSKNMVAVKISQDASSPAEQGNTKKGTGFFKKLESLKSQVTKKVPSLVIGVPDWQKPDNMVPDGPNCQFCGTAFTYKKHNCYICGRLVCLTCSNKNLLVYIPDKCDHERDGFHARWAVIRVVGSPEIEPDKRLYVRACTLCLDGIEAIQVEMYQLSMKEDNEKDCITALQEVHDNIMEFEEKIGIWLPKYKQLIDSLEVAADSPKSLPPTRNNMQILAKHQGDLSDHFTSFVVAVSRLKQMKPKTQTQLKLVKSIMGVVYKVPCKFRYYSDNMYTFRNLQKQLELVSPPEVLQTIQTIVDSQSINSTCLSIGQLAYESLHICLKYKLGETLPAIIKDAYEICEVDLKKIIEGEGQDWEEHRGKITSFIKMQMKGGEGDMTPCRYLRPSRKKTHQFGFNYVNNYLYTRCEEITNKVLLQLQTRCAYRRFQDSKEALGSLRDATSAGGNGAARINGEIRQ